MSPRLGLRPTPSDRDHVGPRERSGRRDCIPLLPEQSSSTRRSTPNSLAGRRLMAPAAGRQRAGESCGSRFSGVATELLGPPSLSRSAEGRALVQPRPSAPRCRSRTLLFPRLCFLPVGSWANACRISSRVQRRTFPIKNPLGNSWRWIARQRVMRELKSSASLRSAKAAELFQAAVVTDPGEGSLLPRGRMFK